MTTPVIDQIYRHVSVRRFTSEPISVELVETIVAAAQRSATSSNLQMYSVVAVTDADRRARLVRTLRRAGADRPGAGVSGLVRRP